jgi:hypothetical protein
MDSRMGTRVDRRPLMLLDDLLRCAVLRKYSTLLTLCQFTLLTSFRPVGMTARC